MSDSIETPAGLEVRTYFVRNRNALVARADFGELYVDYYLHQGQHGYRHEPEHDAMLKEALAAVTLHCASRPWNETTAWTIHYAATLKLNLFVTGDNTRATIVGQLFDQDVKEDGRNLFMADTVRGAGQPRRSVVELATAEVFPSVEQYYQQSEQRPARLFRHAEEDFVMVSAHPDCDMDWFNGLTDESIRALDQTEDLSLLEQRRYRWECGCTELRMMQVLSGPMRSSPEDLFGDDASLRMSCPRCGARYAITREAMEAYIAGKK